MIRSRRLAAALLAAYVAVVGLIVFWPTGVMATDSVYALWGVLHRLGAPEWVSPSLVEFGTNILLFFPLGFLGPTLKPEWRWGNWLLTGFVATTAIELSQYFFLSARSAAVSDVVANTLGAVGGYLLVVLLRRR